MRCQQASRIMPARLDDSLSGAEAARLEDHLAVCSACRAEWERMQAVDRLLGSAVTVQAPTNLRARVMARIARREQARRAILGGTALVLGTSALGLLVLTPLILGLLENIGLAPALISGGPQTVVQLLALLSALSHTVLALLDQFAGPLAVLGLCSLLIALVLNAVLVGTMRRLRPARAQFKSS